MEIINEDKINKKRLMASRMIRKPLATVAQLGGKVGKLASQLDSYLSRTLDSNMGMYKELND